MAEVDKPERAEVAGLVSALRGDPVLRGYVGSVRVALQTGLPAMAYHRETAARMYLRRPLPGEPGSVVAEVHVEDGSTQVVASDLGVVGAKRPPGRLRNITVRLPPDLRQRLAKRGPIGEVLRLAAQEYLDREDGVTGGPAPKLRPPGARGRPSKA